MEFIDIAHMSDLPAHPKGHRYLDFIGGTKQWRCFLVPQNISRGTFMDQNTSLLSEALIPIYKHNGICISQDTSCPLPGFYIISPVQHYKAMDKIDDNLHLRLAFIIKKTREAMRTILGIEHAHILYEEKESTNCHVHYWILPVENIATSPRLYNFNIKDYMSQFSYQENKEKIISYNQKMRAYFSKTHLQEQDDALSKKIL